MEETQEHIKQMNEAKLIDNALMVANLLGEIATQLRELNNILLEKGIRIQR